MIDHVSVGVSDLERCRAVLRSSARAARPVAPGDAAGTIGFGKTYPEFWINLRAGMAPVAPESGVHICLRAKRPAMSMRSTPRR